MSDTQFSDTDSSPVNSPVAATKVIIPKAPTLPIKTQKKRKHTESYIIHSTPKVTLKLSITKSLDEEAPKKKIKKDKAVPTK